MSPLLLLLLIILVVPSSSSTSVLLPRPSRSRDATPFLLQVSPRDLSAYLSRAPGEIRETLAKIIRDTPDLGNARNPIRRDGEREGAKQPPAFQRRLEGEGDLVCRFPFRL